MNSMGRGQPSQKMWRHADGKYYDHQQPEAMPVLPVPDYFNQAIGVIKGADTASKPMNLAVEQPVSKRNDNPGIQALVIEDMETRTRIGIERYGTVLQGHNGRDSLRDAYEEQLDHVIYLRQLIWERDNPQPKPIRVDAVDGR